MARRILASWDDHPLWAMVLEGRVVGGIGLNDLPNCSALPGALPPTGSQGPTDQIPLWRHRRRKFLSRTRYSCVSREPYEEKERCGSL